MAANPFIFANRNGIPRIESRAISVNSTSVSYDFQAHNFINSNYSGLILVKLVQSIPTGTTGTLPIVFTSNNTNAQPLTTFGGVAVTAADVELGIHLVYFEKSTNTLQLIS